MESTKITNLIQVYAEWAHHVRISQDVPINRFISHVFYYMVFLALIVANVINPFLNCLSNEGEEHCHISIAIQILLFVYLLPMIVGYILNLIIFKPTIRGNKFWTFFMMMRDCLLTISVLCNFILYSIDDNSKCLENDNSSVIWHFNNTLSPTNEITEGSMCLRKQILSHASTTTFALGNVIF